MDGMPALTVTGKDGRTTYFCFRKKPGAPQKPPEEKPNSMNYKKGLRRVAIALTVLYIPAFFAFISLVQPYRFHVDEAYPFLALFPIIVWTVYFFALWIIRGFKEG